MDHAHKIQTKALVMATLLAPIVSHIVSISVSPNERSRRINEAFISASALSDEIMAAADKIPA